MKFFIPLLLLFFSPTLLAQQQVQGVVTDENNLPLQSVTIIDKKTAKWTVTDVNGAFSLSFSKEYELHFQYLGMEEKVVTGFASPLKVQLKEESLHLKEVIVTAEVTKKAPTSSAIRIDKYAMSQFQTFSLSDILQQLPGQSITTPSLGKPNVLSSVRSAIDSENNSFGMSYLLDDMQLSNDENMQTFGRGGNTSSFSNAGTGLDLRSIPTSNIDKIEVVTGIADAKYGNATTGLVIIERKAGAFPLQAEAKLQGGGQSLSVNKGFSLSQRAGKLSLSLDYLDANNNPTNSLNSYRRVTGSGIWSYDPSDVFRNSLSLTLRANVDGAKMEREADNMNDKKDYGITLNNRANWQFTNAFIDQLSFQTGASLTYQNDYYQRFLNDGVRAVSVATETSLREAVFTPPSYYARRETEGLPFNFNSQLSVEKNLVQGALRHLLSAGTSLNYSDNYGRGILVDAESASNLTALSTTGNAGGNNVRPLNFNRYVKSSKLWALYLQDNITWERPSGNTTYANIGLRFENQNGFSTLSPRVNIAYEVNKHLKLRAGIGLATKAPALKDMYPGNAVYDLLLQNVSNAAGKRLGLIYTIVKERPKVDLKPAKSWKYELGADIQYAIGKIALTGFINHQTDGFDNRLIFEGYEVPITSVNTTTLEWTVTGQRIHPIVYQQTVNYKSGTDKGVELIANFKKIKALNTTFSLAGSYVHSEQNNYPQPQNTNINYLNQGTRYGLYEQEATVKEKLSFRLTTTYHLPAIGLLISLTAEQFTFNTDFGSSKSIYPYSYIDANGREIYIPIADRSLPQYADLVRSVSDIATKRTPIYHNFHLRLTKEMLGGLSFSLYVTNLFDYHPRVMVNGSAEYKNSDINFGATAKYSF